MNTKPLFALSLVALVLPALAADTGKLADQMKTLDATIAEADAKAEKTCALAKIKVRQKAVEELSAAQKEALRKEDLDLAVALKAKIGGVSGEMDGLLANAGEGKKEKAESAEKAAPSPRQRDVALAKKAVGAWGGGQYHFLLYANGKAHFENTGAPANSSPGAWTVQEGAVVVRTENGKSMQLEAKADEKGNLYFHDAVRGDLRRESARK